VNVSELGSRADAAAVARWDAFVSASPEATFFHRAAWRTVLRDAFGHRPHFLYAESDGRIRGVLPLARQKSLLFGDALVSTPFCVYGGVAADDPAARSALEDAAVALGERLGVAHVEFRNRVPRRDDWVRRSTFATFGREIAADPTRTCCRSRASSAPRCGRASSETWSRSRAATRTAAGTSTRRASTGWARRSTRVATSATSRARSGPTASSSSSAARASRSPRSSTSTSATSAPYYAGSSGDGRDGEVHPFMYWSLMNHAASRGARRFDFGRSPVESGGYAFKKNFGFEPQPLAYEYKLVRGDHVRRSTPRARAWRGSWATWKRLPLWVANTFGPWAARQIG
jgi:hypothetical protein